MISCGCESRETWLDASSIVFAFIRFARKRSNSGEVVRSCVETAYQVGLIFHAACVVLEANNVAEIRPCTA